MRLIRLLLIFITSAGYCQQNYSLTESLRSYTYPEVELPNYNHKAGLVFQSYDYKLNVGLSQKAVMTTGFFETRAKDSCFINARMTQLASSSGAFGSRDFRVGGFKVFKFKKVIIIPGAEIGFNVYNLNLSAAETEIPTLVEFFKANPRVKVYSPSSFVGMSIAHKNNYYSCSLDNIQNVKSQDYPKRLSREAFPFRITTTFRHSFDTVFEIRQRGLYLNLNAQISPERLFIVTNDLMFRYGYFSSKSDLSTLKRLRFFLPNTPLEKFSTEFLVSFGATVIPFSQLNLSTFGEIMLRECRVSYLLKYSSDKGAIKFGYGGSWYAGFNTSAFSRNTKNILPTHEIVLIFYRR